jgi:hypothetical protein
MLRYRKWLAVQVGASPKLARALANRPDHRLAQSDMQLRFLEYFVAIAR